MDRARAGLEARFPSRAQPDALALIGADRGIPRGRTETDAHYAQRLIAWRYPRGHRVRGSAFALLSQVSEYFGRLHCFTIDVKLNRHDRSIDGSEQFSYGAPWNWDGTTDPKGRFWVVLLPLTPLEYTRDDVVAIRALFTGPCPWKPGGTMQEWAIVSTTVTDGSADEPFPDGTWLHWSKIVGGAHRVAARPTTFRYWSLAPSYNNTYAGTPPNQYPAAAAADFPLMSGGTYTGNRANFSAINLTSGGTYVGDRTNFPATITLLDDSNL